MRILPQPDEKTVKAFLRQDGDAILAWFFDEAAPYILEKGKMQKDEVLLRWNQGASQVIDDLREIINHGPDWLVKFSNQRKKEVK